MRTVFACLLAAAVAACGLSASGGEPGVTAIEILRGESIDIMRPDVRSTQPIRLTFAGASITLNFNSDGLLAITDVGGPVSFVVRAGDKGLRARLSEGQSITLWVVKSMTARAGDELSLDVSMTSWSFAMRADKVGPGGLEIATDLGKGVLYDGQRVDSVKSATGEVVLMRSGTKVQPPPRREEPTEPPREVRPSETELAEGREPTRPELPLMPPAPGSLARDANMAGADIALPNMPRDILRIDMPIPPPVSP